MLRTQLRFIFILALLLRAPHALAAPIEYFWNNASGGDYATPGNWTPSGPPSPADDAIFNLGSSGYDVDIATSTQARQLVVENDNVNISVSANVYTLVDTNDLSTNSLVVGDQAGQVGELTVKLGTVEAYNSVIANAAGSQGTLTVDGSAGPATLTNHGELTIGRYGAGTLNVKAGGIASSDDHVRIGHFPGSTGNLNVDGSGSQFTSNGLLIVGSDGPNGVTGNLSITNGGSVTATNSTTVGSAAVGSDSSGFITVDGATSTFQPANLFVGNGGPGTVTVQNGGNVTPTGYIIIGHGGVGQITVTGAGSSLTATADRLDIGQSKNGSGALLIENEGSGSAKVVNLAISAGSSGTLTVTGAGSSFTMGSLSLLTIGESGNATVNVLDGATFTHQGNGLDLGENATGSGSLVVDGAGSLFSTTATNAYVGHPSSPSLGIVGGNGHLTVSNDGTFTTTGTLRVSNFGVVDVQGGTLNIGVSVLNLGVIDVQSGTLNAGVSVANAGIVHLNGTLNGDFGNDGLLTGAGTLNGLLVIGGASTVSPGNSPGALAVGPTDWNGGGTFKFEINSALGTAGVNWDLLNITGGLDLNATANDFIIDLTSLLPDGSAGPLSDFDPSQDYAWTFAKASGVITNFAPENFTVLTGNFGNTFDHYFSVIQVGNELQLLYSVPEPSTIVWGAIGLALLLGAVHKQRQTRNR